MPETAPNRIDVHHHLVPQAFTAALQRHGLGEIAGAKVPEWSPATSIALMDTFGIQTALLSLPTPGVYFGDVVGSCHMP